jgi:hypothetical protein
LSGFQAIVDWPGVYFWRELTVTHPGAKAILTVRDPERWYDSMKATIFSLYDDHVPAGPRFVATRTFHDRVTDRAHCQAVFVQHIEAVQATIAPERLLVFDVKEGWEPLCAFLAVPVPEDDPVSARQRSRDGPERGAARVARTRHTRSGYLSLRGRLLSLIHQCTTVVGRRGWHKAALDHGAGR